MAAATTALTYNSYVTQIATLAVVQTTTNGSLTVFSDTAMQNVLPSMLNYAELRIQRDLDLLPLQTTNTTYTLTTGSNTLTLSVNDFVTLQNIILTSTGTPLLPTTKEFLQNCYGIGSTQGPPLYFAPYGGDSSTAGNTSQLYIVGPIPDQSYALTLVGTIRMPTLYTTTGTGTNTTFISTYLPDLLIMASMIYVSAYQRNWGRQSDDPQMAQSYENQYQTLLKSAGAEEYRKKFEASAWSSMSTPPTATSTR
jgi:hypothetical protein